MNRRVGLQALAVVAAVGCGQAPLCVSGVAVPGCRVPPGQACGTWTSGAFVCTPICTVGSTQCGGCPVVSIAAGPVQGTPSGGTCAYDGLPYAAPPVGSLRWKAPTPPAAWTTPRPSIVSSPCPQTLNDQNLASTNEDCLYLNVWTPQPAPSSRAPVMVFIPGGAFIGGSSIASTGSDHLYDGTSLATATGNLVVTLNYRVGPFGFLSNAALRSEDTAHGSAGNYGILDQVAAFQWVHDNIAAFGGDPANVTMFGESAGGASVLVHLASPASQGLFARAILDSPGANIYPGTSSVVFQQATADRFGATFASALGCTDASTLLSCLRGASVGNVLNASPVYIWPPSTGIAWEPVIDGYVVQADPIQEMTAGSFNKVPTLLGNNRNELNGFLETSTSTAPPTDPTSYLAYEEMIAPGRGAAIVAQYPIASYSGSYVEAASSALNDFKFICPSRRAARAIADAGMPVFRYDFAHAIKYDARHTGAVHGAELLFVFSNPFCWWGSCVALGPTEAHLSQSMMGYWGAMARTGNPNGDGGTTWPLYDTVSESELVLDLTQSTETHLEQSQCDFWDAVLGDGGTPDGG